MTITFNISNVTSNYVKTVMLRKFFQMVFIGNDRKTLNIYTATVLSATNEETQKNKCVRTQYISELDILTEFCIKFGFIVTGNDDNDVVSIINNNITDQERGFLTQVDCIQKVWGNECQILYNNQKKLEEKYCSYMGIKTEDNTLDKDKLAYMAKQKVLWIEDDNKKSEPEMYSIAIPGDFSSENYKIDFDTLLNDGNEKAFYTISVPKEQQDVHICKGIELLNWVKTTIQFKHYLNDQNLNFSIKKSNDTKFVAPDFTWYFSPPIKSFISYESSSVEVGWEKNDNNRECPLYKKCQCSIKPEVKSHLPSQRYDNIINPVANKTTVNFYYWAKNEMIGYRQKYRIMAKNIFTRPEDFDNIKELNIFIDTMDEHGRGNRQYILGIIISFALAFGIDKTRLGDAQKYFPLEKLFLADTWWLFMIILVTFNLLIRPVRFVRKRTVIYWRLFNIIASFIWIFMVFCVDRSQWIMNYIKTIDLNVNYFMIFQILFILLLISNIAYVALNIIKYHDPILASLLGDDIL